MNGAAWNEKEHLVKLYVVNVLVQLNRYGLKRDIPDSIKRVVRQRCGFGCVVCGKAIYQYHHTNPSFADATEHDAAKIVLLCSECHGRVTSGLLSNRTVDKSALSPKCLEKGFSYFPLDINDESDGEFQVRVVLGTTTFINVRSIIKLNNKPLFSILPPETLGSPARLSASFYDISGSEIARIIENEWQSSSANWDVEIVGPKITIRQKLGDICLIIKNDPPKGLTVEKLNMFYQGFKVVADSDRVAIWSPGQSESTNPFAFSGIGPKGGTITTTIGSDLSAIVLSSRRPYRRRKSRPFEF